MNKQRNQGYSLIELMTVVSLCVFVAGFSALRFSFFSRCVVRAELDSLCAACVYAQQTARVENRTIIMTFDEQGGTYSFDGTVVALHHTVMFGTVDGACGPPSSPQNSIGTPITFPKKQIVFHPHGTIASGTVYLVDTDRTCGYALSCSVSAYSYLRRYRYDKQWHGIMT